MGVCCVWCLTAGPSTLLTKDARMNSLPLARHSLKTRITLATLGIFVISIWSLSLYTSRMLRADMQDLLGEQQLLSVSALAAEVNHELDDRLKWLESVAEKITPAMLDNAAVLQEFLAQRLILPKLFGGGGIIYSLDGTAIADSLPATGRIGINYMDTDTVAIALKEGKPNIGTPVMGKKLGAPVFGMTAPIRDAQGKVIGAFAGVINLGIPIFLDKIQQGRYGKTGGYLLVAPQSRLIITASDKKRILEVLPAQGVSPRLDRFIDGFEGTDLFVNPVGVEVLASVKGIPVTGWYLAGVLPTDEAFAPIRAMQQRMLIATILLTLIAGGLTWWMLRRQLAPMTAGATMLSTMADSNAPPQALPIVNQDEIGALVGGFNHLLETLEQRGRALVESEGRFRDMVNTTDGIVWEADATTFGFTFISHKAELLLGYPVEAWYEPGFWVEHLHPEDKTWAPAYCASCTGRIEPHNFEYRFIAKDGRTVWLHDIVTVVAENNAPRWLRGIMIDITERKQADAALVTSEERWKFAIEGAGDGLWDWNIQTGKAFYSSRYKTMLGFSEDEIGDTSDEWSKRIHPDDAPDVFAALQPYMEGKLGSAKVEFRMLRKDGSWMWTMGRGMVVERDASGKPLRMIGTNSDITERKQSEAMVSQLAYHDSLTQLPNRRLLVDRMSQAISASKRSGNYGALMMLDLDNFKPLNDAYGHFAGDLLLKEVAMRLIECVRETDTVARVGGDEFVVMLDKLEADKVVSTRLAGEVAEKIRASLAKPYRLNLNEEGQEGATVEHCCSASIGVVLFLGVEASQTEVMKWVDSAMYRAKDAGRNMVHFYD